MSELSSFGHSLSEDFDLSQIPASEKREFLQLLEEKDRRKSRKKLFGLYPDDGLLRRELYRKHLEFYAAGSQYHERALIGGNRVGKTLVGSYEASLHMIGRYPKWWTGRRFDRPVTVWASGEDSKTVRESLQVSLLGAPQSIGTGMIPGDAIADTTSKSGVPDAFDSVAVKHETGGISRLVFKSYDQGRESFQSAQVDVMLLDEEPPMAIYTEALTRTMATVPGQRNGLLLATFTPLKGLSDVVLSFMPGGKIEGAFGASHKYVAKIGWDDVPHLSDDSKESLSSAYLTNERQARMRGIPSLGSGAIYPVPEEDILVDPFDIPAWYRHVYAIDVGWNRTAVLWGALDPETDTLYLYAEHYRGAAEPEVHAAGVKARGEWIPGVIDPASRGRSQIDGQKLFDIYLSLGLMLSPANNSVESGIYDVWSRLSTGRIKVFRTLQNFLDEYRIYRRDEKGKIVKARDHLMDTLRYLVVSGLQLAAQRPAAQWAEKLGLAAATGAGRHQSAYDPMSEMYGDAVKTNSARTREPWMPHQQGR